MSLHFNSQIGTARFQTGANLCRRKINLFLRIPLVSFVVFYLLQKLTEQKIYLLWATYWLRLRVPSCGPWFESEAQHIRFFGLCI